MMDKLNELFKTYIVKELKLSERTVEAYDRDVRQFCDYLKQNGVNLLHQYKVSYIPRYLEFLKQKGVSQSTIQRKFYSLRKFRDFLCNEHYIENDVVRDFDIQQPEKARQDILSAKEISALLKAPDIKSDKGLRDRAMLELLCATGIKVSELISLNVSDVLIESSAIKCGQGKNKRVIAFHAPVKKILKKYMMQVRGTLSVAKHEKAFFINMTGERLTRQGFCKILKGYASEIGLNDRVSPNTLRYTFAQQLAKSGVEVDSIKDILGHSDKSTTVAFLQTGKQALALSFQN